MKKTELARVVSLMLLLCMVLSLVTGCGTEVEPTETETPRETTPYESEMADARTDMDKMMSKDSEKSIDFEFSYDPAKCIWVDDQYKKIKLKNLDLEISDDEMEAAETTFCRQYAESTVITDRAAKKGDTVVIDFAGTNKKKTICKETNYEFTIGNHEVLKKFEKAIIGAATGDVVTVSIRYSDKKSNGDLAGKKVKYTIRVRMIKTVDMPAFDDTLVKAHTRYDSADAYAAVLKEQLIKDRVLVEIDKWLAENAYLFAIPSSLQERFDQELIDYYTYAGEYYYGIDLNAMLKKAGYKSQKSMLKANASAVQANIENELIYSYIISTEKITSTQGAYQSFLQELAAGEGCAEMSELLMVYNKDQLMSLFMKKLVHDWLYERCKF